MKPSPTDGQRSVTVHLTNTEGVPHVCQAMRGSWGHTVLLLDTDTSQALLSQHKTRTPFQPWLSPPLSCLKVDSFFLYLARHLPFLTHGSPSFHIFPLSILSPPPNSTWKTHQNTNLTMSCS